MKIKTKWIVVIIVVITLAVAAYMFRDKIKGFFGKKDEAKNAPADIPDTSYTAPADTTAATQPYVAPTANTTTSANTVLSKGSRGNDVRRLQQLLVNFGFSVGKSGVDGIFGNDTETALKKAIGKTSVKVSEIDQFEKGLTAAKNNGESPLALLDRIRQSIFNK